MGSGGVFLPLQLNILPSAMSEGKAPILKEFVPTEMRVLNHGRVSYCTAIFPENPIPRESREPIIQIPPLSTFPCQTEGFYMQLLLPDKEEDPKLSCCSHL